MGMFISVEADDSVIRESDGLAKKLIEVCPVNIFDASGDELRIVEENLDECVLCDLCLEVAPTGAVQVRKLYE